MASTTLTGSFSGSNASNYAIKCDCTSSSNGTSANSSNVTVKLYMCRTADLQYSWRQWNLNGDATARIIINGSDSGTGTTTFDTRSTTDWILLKTYTVNNIAHNSDGSKSISISAYFEPNATSSLYGGTVSGTFTLDTIPRASQPSCVTYPNTTTNVGDIGSTIYIHMNRASSSFTHTVRYAWGNKSGTIATGVADNTQWKIPMDFCNDIPSNTSGSGTVYVDTYSGGSCIGTKSVGFTATVPSSVVPTVGTITLDPVDISGNNILVQNKNKLYISVSGSSGVYSSSITSYTFSGPGISSTTTSTSVSCGPISNTGTLTYTVKVTDSRGRTSTSKTATIQCYAYSAPYFSSFNAYRCDSDGNADENGTYIKYNCSLKFASVNNTNSITVKILYKKSTASSYSSISPLTNSTSTSANQFILNSSGDKITFDISSTYDIYATIADKYSGSSQSDSVTIFSVKRILNITSDGTGVAIGKMAESNNLFECRWDAKFDGSASGPSGFSTSSDKRVKKNIQDLDVNIVDNLHPVSYELLQSSDNKTHYGFIAQDVSAVLADAGLDPETIGLLGQIFNNGRQEYVLTYTEFIPLLTKKCQDLQAEINTLKEEISALKDTVTLLQK